MLFLFPKILKVKRFLLLKPHQPSPPKTSLVFPLLIPGHFPGVLFTSLTLEAKGGFKTFCFPPGRQLQTWAVLAGRGKAVLAPGRPGKQMSWIKLSSGLAVWAVSAGWQSSAHLPRQGTARGPWPSSRVSLADVKGCPCSPGTLWNLRGPRLHPAFGEGLVLVLWVQSKDQLSVLRLRHSQEEKSHCF